MKIFWIIIIGCWIGLGACSEDDFSGYSSDNYIYFSKAAADSTIYSFAYDKTQTSAELKLKLNMVSGLEGRDRTFKVRFLADKSTAKEGTHFDLSGEGQVILANDSIGFLKLTVKKSDLGDNSVMAVFQLIESEDFKVGLRSNSIARVIISNQLNRPMWWNDWHETDGLGTYSREKYQAFMDEMKLYDLTQEKDGGVLTYSEVRVLILKFKRILERNPRPDNDGSIMTVAMRG
ncbi:MAG: DUF4843 domain-containing protein [Odoribacter sp.]